MAVSNLKNKSFLTRTLSGIFLIIIALFTLIAGGDILLAFCLLISIIGLYELYHVMKFQKTILALAGYIATIIYYLLVRFSLEEYLLMFIIIVLMVFLAIFVFGFTKYKAEQVFLAFFGIVYVVLMISFIYKVRIQTDGAYIVWLIIISSWGCDTFAYLTGMTIGKHKLAPVLSPKKSIEGSIGGVIGAAVIGGVFALIFKDDLSSMANPILSVAIICAVGGIISQIGDLAASGIKRNYNIKDYGKLIPGHGGILDRFDSMIFTAPIIYLLLLFI